MAAKETGEVCSVSQTHLWVVLLSTIWLVTPASTAEAKLVEDPGGVLASARAKPA